MSARAEPRLVLGTAGHIDHGKTALVRALTGVDTDRLPEEKARGISIELGFAPLDLEPGVRLGVIDVPGHEKFVHTMIAGAAGIDLLLLVVAADEGVMPQTREHLAICELLGVRRAAVALTKRDAVDAETLALAADEVRQLLAPTALAGAPLVPVSARTGQGLDMLRAELAKLAVDTLARTPRSGPPRLPIDRSFEARGFGSVVTGTLLGGAIGVGDPIELFPTGERGRVRGVQTHGAATERCQPGSRCALNLQGISRQALRRGRVISAPGALVPSRTLDARVTWLGSAPALQDSAAIELLVNTSERRARIAPLGAARIEPGSTGFARLHIEAEPLAVLPGDRFVVRGFARTALGGRTLGGGVVLDALPPRRRPSDPVLLRDLVRLPARDPETDLAVRIERSGLAGAARQQLQRETGLADAILDAALDALEKRGQIAASADARRFLAHGAVERIGAQLKAALRELHREEPLQPWVSSAVLHGRLPRNVTRRAALRVIEDLAARGEIQRAEDGVRLASHAPAVSEQTGAQIERVAARLRAAGLEPPSPRDLATQLALDAAQLRRLLAHLAREGRALRAPGDLWFDAAAVAALRERVRAYFDAHDVLDTPRYKALIATPRRSAVPLMELFDAERLTLRDGNARRLHGARRRS